MIEMQNIYPWIISEQIFILRHFAMRVRKNYLYLFTLAAYGWGTEGLVSGYAVLPTSFASPFLTILSHRKVITDVTTIYMVHCTGINICNISHALAEGGGGGGGKEWQYGQ